MVNFDLNWAFKLLTIPKPEKMNQATLDVISGLHLYLDKMQ
jgi:hypothetical protein